MSTAHPAAALENRQRTCDETKVLGYPAPAYEADTVATPADARTAPPTATTSTPSGQLTSPIDPAP
jgi:hypothetical protein